MANYDILPYLQKAGFKGEALRQAWAIANRESGGRANAYNGNAGTGDKSYGMFQINMLGNLGPARLRQYGLKRNEDLFDPNTNARVAYQMSKGGTDFGAWAIGPNAYKGAPPTAFGAYKKYYDQWDPARGGSGMPPGGSQTAPNASVAQTQAPGPPDNRMQRAQLLGMVLNRTSNGSVDSNILARQIQATSPKGTVEPPTVKDASGQASLPTGPNPTIDKVLAAAHEQVGKPYVFGSGPDTSSFDCSDLVQWAYKQAGISIPRVTGDQIKHGKNVKWGEFQPGDLIFSNKGGHVVMYVGNGKVIAAPRTGTVVQYQPVSRFQKSFVTAKRIA